MKKLVIFDLDGTLLNTIADLAAACNHALRTNGFPTHDEAAYNFFVGNGVSKLIERALPDGEKCADNVECVKRPFLKYYDTNNILYSKPYPGIPELLERLHEAGIGMAVASNKYDTAVRKLVAHYFGGIRFAAVRGNREGVPTKPDPAIIYDILAETGTDKDDAVLVGDSAVDIRTAANAGIDSIGVTWGFRPRRELEEAGAQRIIDTPESLTPLLL